MTKTTLRDTDVAKESATERTDGYDSSAGTMEALHNTLKAHTRLLLLPFRSGEAVMEHPDISPLIKDGWRIQRAAPRVTKEGTRLFVVLNRSASPLA